MNYTKSKYALLSILITFSVQSIDCASQKNEKHKNVVVVGRPGVGKSTLIASLIAEVEKDDKGGIRIKENKDNDNTEPLPQIGHGIDAETKSWKSYEIPKTNITIFDTKGFNANQSEEDKEAFKQLEKLFSKKQIDGIIFMTTQGDWDYCTHKNYPHVDAIGNFINHFFNEESIKEHLIPSSCIVFQTLDKAPKYYVPVQKSSVRHFFSQNGKKFFEEPNTNPIVKKKKIFFDGFIKKELTKEQVDNNKTPELKDDKVLFYKPTKDKDKLIETINAFKGIPQQAFDFEKAKPQNTQKNPVPFKNPVINNASSPLAKLKTTWNGYSSNKKKTIKFILFVLFLVPYIHLRKKFLQRFRPKSKKRKKPKSEKSEKPKSRSKTRKS